MTEKPTYSEDSYEQSLIELFERMGYEYHSGKELDQYYRVNQQSAQISLEYIKAMNALNEDLNRNAQDTASYFVREMLDRPMTIANNDITYMLQDGLDIDYRNDDGHVVSRNVKFIDYDNPNNNSFWIVNQLTIENGDQKKRADLVVYVNGWAVAVIELKSPKREVTDAHDAYLQLETYKRTVPDLFKAAQMLIVSDMATTKVGSLSADEDRYMEWKTVDGSYASTAFADFETFFEGIFERRRLLDLIKNFNLTKNTEKFVKILAGYHQYFAVRKALDCTMKAMERKDRKIGVFWHTQGSGKSLSMVFYAHLVSEKFPLSTILVLTDRLDLNEQLFKTFSECQDFLRQEPQKADNGDELIRLLEERKSNGIIFTNIQKFKDIDKPLSTRENIIVISDEAHRSQSNTAIRIDEKTGEIHTGFAARVRKLLPGASFIGFTGTPIEKSDVDTRDVFGDYIDIYDMTQAVEDGATVPVYYESRLIKLNLDKGAMQLLDDEYQSLADEGAEEEDLRRSKMENAKLEKILKAPETIDTLCRDIVDHYENYRQRELTGKAMIVALDREAGIMIYRKLLELRPEWEDMVKVVMTAGNQDPADWAEIIGSPKHKEELATEFKKEDSRLKIVIVVHMWLTGFDVPSLATMYVYKPMKGHNLMQAIARVNRVFPEKSGGLVVDYIGIAQALKTAMHDYTGRDRQRFGDPDIKKTAYEEFKKMIAECRSAVDGYDYSQFAMCSNLERGRLITGGVNHLMAVEREPMKKKFMECAMRLNQLTTLCRSILTDEERYEQAFFETLRTLIMRIGGKSKITKKIIDERIGELLKVSIKADGVVSIFKTESNDFSLFDESFLKEVSEMKERNVARELLKKLLTDRITSYQRKNLAQAEKFSEMMNTKLAQYLKGLITNEEVIKELIQMAHDIAAHDQQLSDLKLTHEEQAFYDALTRPQAIYDFYNNDQLVAMTRELTEAMRSGRTVDWQNKQTARAKMRVMVKRLLKKYNYPPEEIPNAIDTVIKQCELWADN